VFVIENGPVDRRVGRKMTGAKFMAVSSWKMKTDISSAISGQ
jgi:hypothetical protein